MRSAQWEGGGPSPAQRSFLHGPRNRLEEILEVVGIAAEFLRGFRALRVAGPCVTVFGSARFGKEHRHYALARRTGRALAEAGFTVITGGGPGIMEAANRGAFEAGGLSIGATIALPKEEMPNPYLHACARFDRFYVRKVMLVKYSQAFVVLPGGFGTLDEVFETATLIQTRKIERFPVVLMGTDYWQPLVDFMARRMVSAGTIDARDVAILTLTDEPDEAAAIAAQAARGVFGTDWRRRAVSPKRALGARTSP